MIHLHADTIDHALWFTREQNLPAGSYRIYTDAYHPDGFRILPEHRVVAFETISTDHWEWLRRQLALFGAKNQLEWVQGRL